MSKIVILQTVKKAISLFLAIYYLIFSIGLNMNIHICGGKVNSVELLSLAKPHKNCCNGKPMKKDCCKDKKIVIKKSSKDIPTSKVCVNPILIADLVSPSYYFSRKIEIYYTIKSVLVSNHSPPPDSKCPIYVRNHSFLI